MLPKGLRLSKGREIRATLRAKQYELKDPLFYLVGRRNGLSCVRLAIIIPRKLGKSVVRNRIKRMFSSAFFKIRRKIKENVDMVVFPNNIAFEVNSERIVGALSGALHRKALI